MEIKTAKREFRELIDNSKVWRYAIKALHECSLVDSSSKSTLEILLEELDGVMDQHWRHADGWRPNYGRSVEEMGHWTHNTPSSIVELRWEAEAPLYDSLFTLACRFGLRPFVQTILEKDRYNEKPNPWYQPTRNSGSLAQIALQRIVGDMGNGRSTTAQWKGQLDILKLALEYGADVNIPNASYYGFSAWHTALVRCNPRVVSGFDGWAQVLHLMISKSADLDMPVATDVSEREASSPDPGDSQLQTPMEVIQEKFSTAEEILNSRVGKYKVRALLDDIMRALLLKKEESLEKKCENTRVLSVLGKRRRDGKGAKVFWTRAFRHHEIR
ncbi:hypothetical protein DL765_006488 [Monosporascus sp. GIB2]|nr:hypothetical protein DL765_006488 [Monosporascus sp. GIB2]